MKGRPGESLPPADFAAAAKAVEKLIGREAERTRSDFALAVSARVRGFRYARGAVSATRACCRRRIFLYGQQPGEELTIDIEPGKTLIIKLLTVGEPHPDGTRTVFFELNGQPRSVSVFDKSLKGEVIRRPKADPTNPKQIAAPMPGLVVTVPIKAGDMREEGAEAVVAGSDEDGNDAVRRADGKIAEVLVKPGTPVEAGELVVQME